MENNHPGPLKGAPQFLRGIGKGGTLMIDPDVLNGGRVQLVVRNVFKVTEKCCRYQYSINGTLKYVHN